jgi:YbbR domain-containing protein
LLATIKIGDWGIKAGAIVLAVFLWLHAVTEQLYQTETEVRLLVDDPPPGEGSEADVIVAGEIPSTIRVLATGRGKDLLQLDADAFVLRVKTEGNTRIYRLLPSQIEKRATDLDVQISEILEPKEIEIVLDRRIERNVPVQSKLRIGIAEAHIQVGPMRTDPLFVRVIGPQAQVEKLDYIATDSVDLQDVTEEINLVLPLQLPEQRLILDPETVNIQADVQILAEDDLSGVPIKIRNGGSVQLSTDPAFARVKVRGGVDVIAKLDPAQDVELFVDYADFEGASLPIHNAETPLFEVLTIIPSKVNLVGD